MYMNLKNRTEVQGFVKITIAHTTVACTASLFYSHSCFKLKWVSQLPPRWHSLFYSLDAISVKSTELKELMTLTSVREINPRPHQFLRGMDIKLCLGWL